MASEGDDWGRSISIPLSALEETPEQAARTREMLDAAAALGYQHRLSMRKIVRDLGLRELPGAVVSVGTMGGTFERIVMPAEDVTVLLSGEEP